MTGNISIIICQYTYIGSISYAFYIINIINIGFSNDGRSRTLKSVNCHSTGQRTSTLGTNRCACSNYNVIQFMFSISIYNQTVQFGIGSSIFTIATFSIRNNTNTFIITLCNDITFINQSRGIAANIIYRNGHTYCYIALSYGRTQSTSIVFQMFIAIRQYANATTCVNSSIISDNSFSIVGNIINCYVTSQGTTLTTSCRNTNANSKHFVIGISLYQFALNIMLAASNDCLSISITLSYSNTCTSRYITHTNRKNVSRSS